MNAHQNIWQTNFYFLHFLQIVYYKIYEIVIPEGFLEVDSGVDTVCVKTERNLFDYTTFVYYRRQGNKGSNFHSGLVSSSLLMQIC